MEKYNTGAPYLPGIVGAEEVASVNDIKLSGQYGDILEKLVLYQDEGVTHFYGAELDLGDMRRAWLSPVEVDDGANSSYFQLLYVNTTPNKVLGRSDIPVYLLNIDEISFKLAADTHPSHELLNQLLGGDRPKILVRSCQNGMAYFPRSVTPDADPSIMVQHLEKLTNVLGMNGAEVAVSLTKVSADSPMSIPHSDEISITHARQYEFEKKPVFTYGINLENDPWKYYDIFTPVPIENVDRNNVLVRLDSGCDIGQIYNDRGCDCREQLHTALVDMQDLGHGMVIHIPSQDGRGYGAATKMETEGLKRGDPMITNSGNLVAMDTIAAARHLFGDHYDIRSYDGAGRILAGLGIQSIILQTDNRLKTEGLSKGGIKVIRKPTNTIGANGSHRHVSAKHRESGIYYQD